MNKKIIGLAAVALLAVGTVSVFAQSQPSAPATCGTTWAPVVSMTFAGGSTGTGDDRGGFSALTPPTSPDFLMPAQSAAAAGCQFEIVVTTGNRKTDSYLCGAVTAWQKAFTCRLGTKEATSVSGSSSYLSSPYFTIQQVSGGGYTFTTQRAFVFSLYAPELPANATVTVYAKK